MGSNVFAGFAMIALAASAYADVNSAIQDQKEVELEADHDAVQIRDLEAEKKAAREQALVQEQIEREAHTRLAAVRGERETVMARAKSDIAAFETRRKEAEKLTKTYKEETEKHLTDIKKLEESIKTAQKAALDAEAIMAAGREEMADARQKKSKLEEQNRQALYAQTQAESQMSQLRAEWNRLSASIKDLEQRVQQNQNEARKKQEMAAHGAGTVTALQQKENSLKTALGIKPVGHGSPRNPNTVADKDEQTNQAMASAKVTKSVEVKGASTASSSLTSDSEPQVQAEKVKRAGP